MKEKRTQEQVRQFNEMPPSEYANVVALAGGQVHRPEPEGLAAARIIAHKDEEISTLQDFGLRVVQQLQDELDEAGARGEVRPDLEALIAESERVLGVREPV